MQTRTAGLLGLVATLARTAVEAARALALLVAVFVLGLVAGALLILRRIAPAFLRTACVALFVAGLVAGALGVGWLYADMTDLAGGVIIAAALAWLLIANLLLQKDRIWSALALAGALGILLYFLIPMFESNADFRFVARGLPVTIAAAGLIYLMVRFRRNKGESHHGTTTE